jgi:predicted porin
MNNTIKLAVASALLAAASSASAAGGIVAGDWTLDIGGVVNAYYTSTKFSGAAGVIGAAPLGLGGGQTTSNITTGLLPNYLAISGKTRQNDLDVAFTISINPGASTTNSGFQGAQQENRQAFLTFGDASWGSIKLGKDLGIYASDAILNDMTLLGVGSGAGSLAGNTTTLGRIGSGFMYADWKSQVAYTSPNFNGLSFTAGVTQAWNATSTNFDGDTISQTSTARGGNEPAFEAKASYAFTADQVNGKVWVSGISQKIEFGENVSRTATSGDVGLNVNAAGFGLTGYYYTGKGIGQTLQFRDGFDLTGQKRKSEGGYVQGTYTLPGVGTKLGVSWGQSELKATAFDASAADISNVQDEMWTAGVYHPITKHLNLVAEYSESERKISGANEDAGESIAGKAKTVSLGAILFF